MPQPPRRQRLGLLLQRQLLMNWLLCVPIAAVWFYTEEILLALGEITQSAEHLQLLALLGFLQLAGLSLGFVAVFRRDIHFSVRAMRPHQTFDFASVRP